MALRGPPLSLSRYNHQLVHWPFVIVQAYLGISASQGMDPSSMVDAK